MVSRYISPDLGPTYRLKALLGDKWYMLNPREHPLGTGRVAVDKYLAAQTTLNEEERIAMADFKRWAEIIDLASGTWRPHEDIFVKDLLTATKCRSLLFEIEVISGCLYHNVTAYEWPIYRQGERDIQATGPDVVVECKLTDSIEISRVLKRTSRARRQSRPPGVPLAVAVGFNEVLNQDQVDFLANEARKRHKWFMDRPDLAAVLVVVRTARSRDGFVWDPLGFNRGITYHAEVVEIRNDASTVPLPKNFSFGGPEGLQRIRQQRGLPAAT